MCAGIQHTMNTFNEGTHIGAKDRSTSWRTLSIMNTIGHWWRCSIEIVLHWDHHDIGYRNDDEFMLAKTSVAKFGSYGGTVISQWTKRARTWTTVNHSSSSSTLHQWWNIARLKYTLVRTGNNLANCGKEACVRWTMSPHWKRVNWHKLLNNELRGSCKAVRNKRIQVKSRIIQMLIMPLIEWNKFD